MNVIQQTAKIDSSRRVLTLERPLPESVSAGRVDVQVFILPLPAEPPRKKRPYKSICGIIEGQGVTVESFLAEKRADDAIEFAREGR